MPIVFCETRHLAEEWTDRYLAAARSWAGTEHAVTDRIAADDTEIAAAPSAPEPSTAELRAWARAAELTVPDRGRLRRKSGTPGATPTRRTRIARKGIRLRNDNVAAPPMGDLTRAAPRRTDDNNPRERAHDRDRPRLLR
jgi:hypothetical protein